MRLILFSGPIAVGKSTVAEILIREFGYQPIKTSPYLKECLSAQNIKIDREALQNFGDQLDIDTDFRWVTDEVIKPRIEGSNRSGNWLIDSIRKKRQAEHIRNEYGSDVLHIHFYASEQTLKERYDKRLQQLQSNSIELDYLAAISHSNEQHARSLIDIADKAISLEDFEPVKIAEHIMSL